MNKIVAEVVVKRAQVAIGSREKVRSELHFVGRFSSGFRAVDEEGNELSGFEIRGTLERGNAPNASLNEGYLSVDREACFLKFGASISEDAFDQCLVVASGGACRLRIDLAFEDGPIDESGAPLWSSRTIGAIPVRAVDIWADL